MVRNYNPAPPATDSIILIIFPKKLGEIRSNQYLAIGLTKKSTQDVHSANTGTVIWNYVTYWNWMN